VSPIVTQESSEIAKSNEDVFLNKLDYDRRIISGTSNDFHPFGHIIYRQKNKEDFMRKRKRTHKVKPLYIRNPISSIPLWGISCHLEIFFKSLALVTCDNKSTYILKEVGLIESCLNDFDDSLIGNKMSTTTRSMKTMEDTLNLILLYTSLINVISNL